MRIADWDNRATIAIVYARQATWPLFFSCFIMLFGLNLWNFLIQQNEKWKEKGK
jgi:hypothetical protein